MQATRGEGFLVARLSGAATTHIPAIREVVRDLDPDLPVFDVRAMSDRAADATWRTRFSTVVVSLFAAMTFALSAQSSKVRPGSIRSSRKKAASSALPANPDFR